MNYSALAALLTEKPLAALVTATQNAGIDDAAIAANQALLIANGNSFMGLGTNVATTAAADLTHLLNSSTGAVFNYATGFPSVYSSATAQTWAAGVYDALIDLYNMVYLLLGSIFPAASYTAPGGLTAPRTDTSALNSFAAASTSANLLALSTSGNNYLLLAALL